MRHPSEGPLISTIIVPPAAAAAAAAVRAESSIVLIRAGNRMHAIKAVLLATLA